MKSIISKIKTLNTRYLLLGLLLCAVGICFVSMHHAPTALAITVGVCLATAALAYAAVAVAKGDRGASFILKIIFSVMALAAGIAIIIFKDAAMDITSAVISLLLIMDASFKIHTAAMSKRYSASLWWMILILAILTAAGGFVSLKILTDKLSLVLGATILVDGVADLLASLFTSVYKKKEALDVYYQYYIERILEEHNTHDSNENTEETK